MATASQFKRVFLALIPCLLVAIMLFGTSGCTTSSAKGYRMHSKGMEPSVPAGTLLSIDERIYKTTLPKRHDFVGFRPSFVTQDVFVFRVVGLPGEAIKLTKQGLWINGKKFVHPKGIQYTSGSRNDISLKLKAEEYFLLGDNQEMAIDSRHLGPAHKIHILGKILGVSD